MANQNPNIVDGSGRRQIASYYYPLIGPYGSSDHDVIEYQLLLMKYAGIDGVLIDWPGTIQTADYPKNRQNSEAIMGMTAQMGLEFGVVYEDHNVGLAYSAGAVGNEIAAGMGDMAYVRDNYFSKPNYTIINGAPLLLVFGPQTFTQPSDWGSVLSVFPTKPTFLTLWYQSGQAGANAQGEFAWLYSDFTTGLENFYNNRPLGVKCGVAYPGFNTFYAAGGWGAGPGWTLPYNGAGTFSATLQLAVGGNDGFVQVATWNDYGEGTMIEPTREFGYGFLTALQQALGVGYSQTELELVATLYQQRKQYAGNTGREAQLDQASSDLANLQVAAAGGILNGTSSGGTTGTTSSGTSSGTSGGTSSGTSGGSAASSGGMGASSSGTSSRSTSSSGNSGSSGGGTSGSTTGGAQSVSSSGGSSSSGGATGGASPDASLAETPPGSAWLGERGGRSGCASSGTMSGLSEAGAPLTAIGLLLGGGALRRRAGRRRANAASKAAT